MCGARRRVCDAVRSRDGAAVDVVSGVWSVWAESRSQRRSKYSYKCVKYIGPRLFKHTHTQTLVSAHRDTNGPRLGRSWSWSLSMGCYIVAPQIMVISGDSGTCAALIAAERAHGGAWPCADGGSEVGRGGALVSRMGE